MISRLDGTNLASAFTSSFNLVIEVLLISSELTSISSIWGYSLFQSRNRGSFDFKSKMISSQTGMADNSFNLVIEVLLISSSDRSFDTLDWCKFQSRNRGSFDFKKKQVLKHMWDKRSFNLVIEVLLISSVHHRTHSFSRHSFNLVIEVLLISRGTV